MGSASRGTNRLVAHQPRDLTRHVSFSPLATAAVVAILAGHSELSCQVSSPEGTPITGSAVPELAGIDRMMQSFVGDHEAPGAALCLAKDGRIVYARGFGWANVDDRGPVQPDSLFRIASVSKPITAMAIIQLCDREKLELEDRVFQVLGLANDLDPESPLRDITISHLLQHTGGWDSGSTFDPLFATNPIARALQVEPPLTQRQVIEFMVRQPLQSTPGERHAYSNFGYVLLGRVIEACSDLSYESYVRQEVLSPLGITGMHLGRSLPEERLEAEVTYYDATGTVTTVLANIASVGIVLRGVSNRPAQGSTGDIEYLRDSLTTHVAFRN